MAFSGLASLTFTVRSADKTANGDIGRAPVTLVQGASVVKAAKEYQNPLSKMLKYAITTACKDENVKKAARVMNFAADNINYLIGLSCILKVGMAKEEDRTKTLIAETGCFTGMILGEGWMKKNLNKYLEQLTINKKWIPLIKGIVFVTGSITCSTFGEYICKKIANYWDKPLVKQNEKNTKPKAKAYTPLDIKS